MGTEWKQRKEKKGRKGKQRKTEKKRKEEKKNGKKEKKKKKTRKKKKKKKTEKRRKSDIEAKNEQAVPQQSCTGRPRVHSSIQTSLRHPPATCLRPHSGRRTFRRLFARK